MADGLTPIASLLWSMLSRVFNDHRARREEFFIAHIEPLQDKVIEIHKDYIKGFEEVRSQIANGARPPMEFVEFLRSRRRDMECQRQLSRQLARVIRQHRRRGMTDNNWKAIESYCRSVTRYFHASANLGDISWYSDFLNFMESYISQGVDDIWGRMPISPDSQRSMLGEVDNVLKNLPKAFDRVCARYADLRSLML